MTVPCVRVPRADGEEIRRTLAADDHIDEAFEIVSDATWVYVPVRAPDAIADDYTVVHREMPERSSQSMPGDLLGFEPSYERLGDIAIIDEDDDARANTIARAIVDSDLPIDTVLNKASKITGNRRTRSWEILVGNSTETLHREFGVEFALDLASVYFSPRLATERHRVIEQVHKDERVFDMFTGVGPFAVPMALKGATVVGCDINPVAIEYLRENAERNGVADRIQPIEGDVREVADDYAGWADRIVMNLPHSADTFLEPARSIAGEACILHYYDIQHEDDPFGPGEAAIRSAMEPAFSVEVSDRRVVRSYAPHELNVCLDVKLRRTNETP